MNTRIPIKFTSGDPAVASERRRRGLEEVVRGSDRPLKKQMFSFSPPYEVWSYGQINLEMSNVQPFYFLYLLPIPISHNTDRLFKVTRVVLVCMSVWSVMVGCGWTPSGTGQQVDKHKVVWKQEMSVSTSGEIEPSDRGQSKPGAGCVNTWTSNLLVRSYTHGWTTDMTRGCLNAHVHKCLCGLLGVSLCYNKAFV